MLGIEGLIFDAGSTLLTFTGDRDLALAEASASMADYFLSEGQAIDSAPFRTSFVQRIVAESERRELDYREKRSYQILEEQLAADGLEGVPGAILEQGLRAFYQVIERYWMPIPNVAETLSELQQQGYRLGLVSNATDSTHVRRLIEKAGIRAFFDPFIVSADIGFRKPSPKPFQVVLDAWGLPPSQIVMIGDSLEHDVLGANLLGLRSIWFRGGRSTLGEGGIGGELKPDWVAEAFTDIPRILREMSDSDDGA